MKTATRHHYECVPQLVAAAILYLQALFVDTVMLLLCLLRLLLTFAALRLMMIMATQ